MARHNSLLYFTGLLDVVDDTSIICLRGEFSFLDKTIKPLNLNSSSSTNDSPTASRLWSKFINKDTPSEGPTEESNEDPSEVHKEDDESIKRKAKKAKYSR
jgi:hypothetical protein